MKKIIHVFLLLIAIAWLMYGTLQTQESSPQSEQVEQTTLTIQGPTDKAELEAFLDGFCIKTFYLDSCDAACRARQA